MNNYLTTIKRLTSVNNLDISKLIRNKTIRLDIRKFFRIFKKNVSTSDLCFTFINREKTSWYSQKLRNKIFVSLCCVESCLPKFFLEMKLAIFSGLTKNVISVFRENKPKFGIIAQHRCEKIYSLHHWKIEIIKTSRVFFLS